MIMPYRFNVVIEEDSLADKVRETGAIEFLRGLVPPGVTYSSRSLFESAIVISFSFEDQTAAIAFFTKASLLADKARLVDSERPAEHDPLSSGID